MREHYLVSNRDEADADGNMPCRCGDWREPGPMGSDEDDWDHHLAEAVLAVRDHRMEQLTAVFDENARRHKATQARVDELLADLAAETALRKERTELHDLWRAEANELGAAIKRVRDLHTRVAVNDECHECSKRDYPDYSVPWPCPTIAALDGPADITPETTP
jgi:hypothetical protein